MKRYRAGQAIAIGRALATMVLLSALYALSEPAWTRLYDAGITYTDATAATTGMEYLGYLHDYYLPITLFIMILGVVALSIYQRRAPG